MEKSFTHSLAFIFNQTFDQVVLIEKQRPDWQKGFWNGLGGKVEAGESVEECVVREIQEESSLLILEKNWTKIAILTAQAWHAQVFAARIRQTDQKLHSTTGEQVQWFDVSNLPKVIDNLPWLIPLCLNKLQNPDLERVIAKYDSTNRS